LRVGPANSTSKTAPPTLFWMEARKRAATLGLAHCRNLPFDQGNRFLPAYLPSGVKERTNG
jgi:hypothetical protein